MKKIVKLTRSLALIFFAFLMVVTCACGSNKNQIPEKVELASTMFKEIEFENSDTVKLKQDENEVKITGTINKMSDSQKNVFGVDDVTHVVVLKFTFDRERTISYFKIKGETTKVYSDNSKEAGYTGKLSDLLDNEDNEDAFCYLILSANTKSYELTAKYTDGQVSNVKVEITATLATAIEQ